ncbi:hypothetical protein AWB81_08125 [Caballeronia arationis]|nr:hypothetical protein AWB81_08125 [Caballeronia arationis]
MLRQVAWEIQYLPRKRRPGDNQRVLRVQPRLAEALQQVLRIVEPLMALRDPVDDLRVDAQRLARLPQRAARPIRGDRRRDRRAVTSILSIDVLDDLFAPLMLEIDIDIGRLAALLADESLEQHVAA